MKKKISIFINSISAGGAERVVSLLLHELKNDFDIYLVLLQNTIEYDLPAEQKIFYLNQSDAGNSIVKLLQLPFLALRYKKFCKKNDIRISLSFLKRANYINCLSRMFGSRSKIIISERTHLSSYLNFLGATGKISGKFLTKKLYPTADLIITNSILIRADLEKNFNIKTRFAVINNPVNVSSIREQGTESADPGLFGRFTFISVGGFRREKNYELLIEAFNKIRDLDCTLLLVGKGEDEIRLKNMASGLHPGSKIIFPGFTNNPYKYLSKADCFILSSDFEGFPNSIQEALACGLPVISTDCRSGPREILAPDTDIHFTTTEKAEVVKYGILVPVKNAEILAKAMRLMYSNNALRDHFASIAIERAGDYDVGKIAGLFKKILNSDQFIQ